jgi:aminoglycoside phosphotransferase
MRPGVPSAETTHEQERAALLTDATRMKAHFQHNLPGFAAGTLRVDDCEILHTRYRTSDEHRREGKAFLSVCYRLDVRDITTTLRGTQLLQTRAYRDGRSARAFAHARNAHRVTPCFGDAVAQLRELDAVVWAFPNDPKLPHLPEVMDPVRLRRHLPYASLPAGFDSAEQIREITIDIVRYKPEVRCTTRYGLLGGGPGEPPVLTIFGKTFGHTRAPEILRRIESVWRSEDAAAGGFIVPRPLGCTREVKTVWQSALSGDSLADAIAADNCERYLRNAAQGLATLHRSDPGGLSPTTLTDRLDAVRAETAEIGRAFPRLQARFAAVTATLEAAALALPPCREGLIHGDFLLKQLVVHGERLGVFDFDNFSVGDSIQDLGNFIVDLRYHEFDAALVTRMTATFLRSYRAAADWDVPAARVNWHVSVQLLRDAYYFHKRKRWMQGFETDLERLLVMAERPSVDA